MTAGDVIRDALEAGESQLGLAKRLAGAGGDVERWRYVVMRAARGGEPQQTNVSRIAVLFGLRAEDLAEARQARPSRSSRLEELEATVEAQTTAIDALRQAVDLLREALEAQSGAPIALPLAALPRVGVHRRA